MLELLRLDHTLVERDQRTEVVASCQDNGAFVESLQAEEQLTRPREWKGCDSLLKVESNVPGVVYRCVDREAGRWTPNLNVAQEKNLQKVEMRQQSLAQTPDLDWY